MTPRPLRPAPTAPDRPTGEPGVATLIAEQLQILSGIAGRGGPAFGLLNQLLAIAHDEATRLKQPFLRGERPGSAGESRF